MHLLARYAILKAICLEGAWLTSLRTKTFKLFIDLRTDFSNRVVTGTPAELKPGKGFHILKFIFQYVTHQRLLYSMSLTVGIE